MIQTEPRTEEYKTGFNDALVKARECVKREISAYGFTQEKPSDHEVSSLTHLRSVDTAIQQVYPR